MKELPGDIHPDFPVKIELGKTMDSTIGQPVKPNNKDEKKKYYPCLYLSDIEGLEDIPKEGHAIIYFRKKGSCVREDEKGKVCASADLEIEDIHFQEKEESEDGEDMEEEMKEMLEGKKSDESEDEED